MANSLKHQSNKQGTFTSQKRNILVVSVCGSCLILLHVAFAFVSISYVLGIFHLYLNLSYVLGVPKVPKLEFYQLTNFLMGFIRSCSVAYHQ